MSKSTYAWRLFYSRGRRELVPRSCHGFAYICRSQHYRDYVLDNCASHAPGTSESRQHHTTRIHLRGETPPIDYRAPHSLSTRRTGTRTVQKRELMARSTLMNMANSSSRVAHHEQIEMPFARSDVRAGFVCNTRFTCSAYAIAFHCGIRSSACHCRTLDQYDLPWQQAELTAFRHGR